MAEPAIIGGLDSSRRVDYGGFPLRICTGAIRNGHSFRFLGNRYVQMNVQDHSDDPQRDNQPDSTLIEQALAGDPSAYDCLVQRHAGRLLTMIRSHVGNREDAEDLMQETLAQGYFKLDTYAGKSAFFTWLFRIAFNLTITKRRKRRLESTHERTPMDVVDTPADPSAAVDKRISDVEQACRVRAAIDRLEEDRRMVLVLRDIDGMDYGEIAEALQIPKGTVRSRLHRARTDLRDLLASDESSK